MHGFYRLTVKQRRAALEALGVESAQLSTLAGSGEDTAIYDAMSENVIGTHRLPLGILTGIGVNGKTHRVAMATEESSVVAAANRAAKLFDEVAEGGGVDVDVLPSDVSAQIAVRIAPEMATALKAQIESQAAHWLSVANACDPKLSAVSGGAYALELTESTPMIQTHIGEARALVSAQLRVRTADAMGANAVNTMAEAILAQWTSLFGSMDGFEPLMAIVTNGNQGCRVCARVRLPEGKLRAYFERKGSATDAGIMTRSFMDKMVAASCFAQCDTRRAATHNKGILNGIVAAALPLGQDTRAIAAAVLDDACRTGRHLPLSVYDAQEAKGDWILEGKLETVLPVGAVGGVRRIPSVAAAFEFADIDHSDGLASVLAAVGLAQNFAALWALVTEGIQRGHMKLHAKKNRLI